MTGSSLRAALYARVSSQQQAEANTIASQVEALQARIRADGLRLEAEFCFVDEGHSGSTLFRPAWSACATRPPPGPSIGCTSTRPTAWPATTPCKCCSWTNGRGRASRSSSSTGRSANPPKKTCFCRFRG